MKKKPAHFRFSLRAILLGFSFVLVLGYVFLTNQKGPCANSISCIKDLSGAYDSSNPKAVYFGKEVTAPSLIAKDPVVQPVLGKKTGAKKQILVDLTNQRLFAMEDNDIVYSFPISSGKWGATPTGEFKIWIKLRYTRMAGGNSAIGTYYNLPNVPYTMFFANDEVSRSRGFSIHGAYWHNNFGHPMSHGCINMAIEDAGKIYAWADPTTAGSTTYASAENPGTLVKIYGSPLE